MSEADLREFILKAKLFKQMTTNIAEEMKPSEAYCHRMDELLYQLEFTIESVEVLLYVDA